MVYQKNKIVVVFYHHDTYIKYLICLEMYLSGRMFDQMHEVLGSIHSFHT